MFCKYCGTEITGSSAFCSNCGKSTEDVSNQDGMSITAIAALILGIVGIVAWLIPVVGFPVAVIGIVFGILGRKKGWKKTGICGIVLCSITLVLTVTNIAIDVYQGYNMYCWIRKETGIQKIDPAKNRYAKRYRVESDEELTEAKMNDVVYKLQKRVEAYSVDAKVFMRKKKAEWYVDIMIPEITDEKIYREIISDRSLELVARYGMSDEEVIINDSNIKSASTKTSESKEGFTEYIVEINLTMEGQTLFAEGTSKYVGEAISVIYDGKVISSPVVNEPIENGQVYISGLATFEEADKMATLIRIGSLGVYLEEVK